MTGLLRLVGAGCFEIVVAVSRCASQKVRQPRTAGRPATATSHETSPEDDERPVLRSLLLYIISLDRTAHTVCDKLEHCKKHD